MTFSDWLIDIALILIVFRQLKERRIDRRFVIVPLVLVGIAVSNYAHTFPTAGNDILLYLALGGIGAALGLASGITTKVRGDGAGHVLVRADAIAAGLWVLGMGARLVFIVWASHGGATTLDRFSVAHNITSGQAWTMALVTMAVAEVVVRMGAILLRARSALDRDRHQPGRTVSLV
jgi:uncharacterized membrane-anchored protein YitT (DUF2179 family)